MHLRSKLLMAATAALCLTTALDAQAAGFQLKEQSSAMQGHSFAGATAKADDLSTMFFNPAGMTRLEEGTHASLTSAWIIPSAEFEATAVVAGAGGAPTIADNDGGDAGVAALVPSFYGATSFGDKWRAGIAVNTPFGLSTKYNNGWVGRYYALESELMTINVAPTLAYKFSDTFSIGGNVQAQYAKAKLTNAINLGALALPDGHAKLQGDDIAFGYGFGALWQAAPDTRVGLNYRSRIKHNLEGDINITAPGAPPLAALADASIEAKLTTPDVLSLGVAHEMNEQWTLLGDVAWTNWSLFDRLTVRNQSNGAIRQDVDESWHDTVFIAGGAEYKHSPEWTFRGGVAFDKGAVGTDHRTFRVPESNRYWISTGATYAFAPSASLDLSYTYIHARDSEVIEDDTVANGSVTGDFEANVNILTAGVNFKF